MKNFAIALIVVVLALQNPSLGQNLPQPILEYAALPFYPPPAIGAHVEGHVKLSFVLTQSGEVVDVRVLSGPEMLTEAAVKEVRTWHFRLPRDLFRTEWRYETEFVYRFSGIEVKSNAAPKLTVSLATFDHVEVITDAVKPVVQY